jgi:hypothetical protein
VGAWQTTLLQQQKQQKMAMTKEQVCFANLPLILYN